jgi:hypothetical protein
VAVTLAVLYGFYRRFVLRPQRLEPNREALLVLGLILAIMVTDFAFDGFRFALLAKRLPALRTNADWAFAGSALAQPSAAVAGRAAGRLCAELLDTDGRGLQLPGAAAGR